MTWPLTILAVLTVIAGWAVGVPSDAGTRFARFLSPVLPAAHESGPGGVAAYLLLILSVIVVGAGVVLAWLMYLGQPLRVAVIGQPRTAVHRLLLDAYGIDRLYDRAIVQPLYRLFRFFADAIDAGVIDGLVNGLGRAVLGAAGGLRRLQTGYVLNYALTMLAGAVLVVGFLLTR